MQLTLNRTVTGISRESLNGYMVAPREDTGTSLSGAVPYVGSWVLEGADQKHVCGNVSTYFHAIFLWSCLRLVPGFMLVVRMFERGQFVCETVQWHV